MGRHAGAYKSEKRKKELSRIKKREEKRMKRIHKPGEVVEGEAGEPTEGLEASADGEAPVAAETGVE